MPATSRFSGRVYRTLAWALVASLYPLRLYAAHVTPRRSSPALARITILDTTGREASAMRRRA